MAKLALCLLALTVLEITVAVQHGISGVFNHEPNVVVEHVVNVTPEMQSDAVEFLKTAYYSTSGSKERLDTWKDLFVRRYPSYNWHVVQEKASNIQPFKSIELVVGDDTYLLYATDQ